MNATSRLILPGFVVPIADLKLGYFERNACRSQGLFGAGDEGIAVPQTNAGKGIDLEIGCDTACPCLFVDVGADNGLQCGEFLT